MNAQTNAFVNDSKKFLDFLEAKKYSPSTLASRQNALNKFIAFLQKQNIQRFQDVTLGLFEQYRLSLTKNTLSPYTIESYLWAVRRLFDYLEHNGLLFENPTRAVPIRKTPIPLPKVISVDQVKKLLSIPNLKKPLELRDRAILETLYATGIRREELISMTLFDIDFERETIRVLGKGKKQRNLPWGQKAVFYTQQYIKSVRPQLLNRTLNIDRNHLWLTRLGNPITIATIPQRIKKYAKAAGIASLSTHTLRRSCASHMLQNGAHPLLIAQLLGHADLKTLSHYLRLTINDLKTMHQNSKPGR